MTCTVPGCEKARKENAELLRVAKLISEVALNPAQKRSAVKILRRILARYERKES